MGKDPAFLFYYQDFLVGTEFLTLEECGIYIRLLCHQADKGRLSLEHMQSICKAYGFTKNIQSKFIVDDKGCYYNERLEQELIKRKAYTESRRKNAKAYAKHMENENENEDININKDKKGIVKGKQKKIKTPISDTFTISERVKKWGEEKGYTNLQEHLESFILKCKAKEYEYVDWDSAFMEAIRGDWAKINKQTGGNDNDRLKVLRGD